MSKACCICNVQDFKLFPVSATDYMCPPCDNAESYWYDLFSQARAAGRDLSDYPYLVPFFKEWEQLVKEGPTVQKRINFVKRLTLDPLVRCVNCNQFLSEDSVFRLLAGYQLLAEARLPPLLCTTCASSVERLMEN